MGAVDQENLAFAALAFIPLLLRVAHGLDTGDRAGLLFVWIRLLFLASLAAHLGSFSLLMLLLGGLFLRENPAAALVGGTRAFGPVACT